MAENRKYNLIIVDDHKMFREGVKFLLEGTNNFKVLAEADNGDDYLLLLDAHKPDIVLMDIDMPKNNGRTATKKSLELHPELKIIVLSMCEEIEVYRDMVEAGVKGYVLKKSGSNELLNAINAVIEGGEYYSPDIMKQLLTAGDNKTKSNRNLPNILTKRELDILVHICNGLSAKEIASKLNISSRTVDVHKSNLFAKTGCVTTNQLVSYCHNNGIVNN